MSSVLSIPIFRPLRDRVAKFLGGVLVTYCGGMTSEGISEVYRPHSVTCVSWIQRIGNVSCLQTADAHRGARSRQKGRPSNKHALGRLGQSGNRGCRRWGGDADLDATNDKAS